MAARLCSLTLPSDAFTFSFGNARPCGGSLPVVAPSLQSLEFGQCPALVDTRHLSVLTALSVWVAAGHHTHDIAPRLLRHIGAFTNLRSLALAPLDPAWAPAEASWLSRLTQLTCLLVGFMRYPDAPAARSSTLGVGVAAARLPRLRCLKLGAADLHSRPMVCDLLPFDEGDGLFRQLAAATQLRHLRLESLLCPEAEASRLSSLRGLTALELHGCVFTGGPDAEEAPPTAAPHWIAALTNLQVVRWWQPTAQRMAKEFCRELPLLALASLPKPHTLALAVYRSGYALSRPMTDMLAAHQGRLQRLQLWGWLPSSAPWRGEAVYGMLERMPLLHTLDVSRLPEHVALLQYVRLPGNLRTCCIAVHQCAYVSKELLRLRARYPSVAFRNDKRYLRDDPAWGGLFEGCGGQIVVR